jgi:hypothetical protein
MNKIAAGIKNLYTEIKGLSLFYTAIAAIVCYAQRLLVKRTDFFTEALYPLAVFTLFLIISYLIKNHKNYNRILNSLVFGIALMMLLLLVYNVLLTFKVIPLWDYKCFYLFGKVGVFSNNFYDPAEFLKIFQQLNMEPGVDSEFKDSVVDVGFWYPPPSMFIFLALGYTSLHTGYIIWQTVIIILFFISLFVLLNKRFYLTQHPGANTFTGGLFTVFIVLLFPDLVNSVYYSQIIGLFLLLLVLLISNLNNPKAGIFLCLLIIVKPLALIFVFYFLLYKKWNTLKWMIGTGTIIFIISLFVWGIDPYIKFITASPYGRIPHRVAYEYVNHSLNAVLLRAKYNYLNDISLTAIKIIYYTLCAVLFTLTILFSKRLNKTTPQLAFLLFIPMVFMIYPNTLYYYSMITLPVLLYIFYNSPFYGRRINYFILLSLFAILVYSLFLYNLILWLIIVNWPLIIQKAKTIRDVNYSLQNT